MTPAERLELIHRPFFITYIGHSYPHGGCIVGDSFPKGREGADMLHDGDVDPFPIEADYVLIHGKRFLPETHQWPTCAIEVADGDRNFLARKPRTLKRKD